MQLVIVCEVRDLLESIKICDRENIKWFFKTDKQGCYINTEKYTLILMENVFNNLKNNNLGQDYITIL